VALFHRLTDLGDRPAATLGPARGDPGSRALDALEPRPRDAGTPAAVQRDPEEALSRSKAHSQDASSSQDPRTDPDAAGSASSRDRSVSPLHPEVAEWDFAANTFCPPPLYYTNWTQEKTPPPARVEITIEPHRNVPEELDGVIPETKLVNPPTHPSLPKHENSATQERPPKLANPPHIQDVGAVNQTPGHPQTEQNMINTIRQLPLLNALLIELSLLYNQPVASPTHVHPHLAWLYRTEDKAQESSTKSTCQSGSKRDKRSVGEHEKTVSSQYAKSQVENLKKGEYFEKNNGGPPKKVAKGRLLYGLTNTLRLRLKQTNPDMLIVHEKREQYRKMKAHMLGTKFRIPSCKGKVLSFAEPVQKSYKLPAGKHLDSDGLFAENSGTSWPVSGISGEPSTTKTKMKCATEKETSDGGENRTSNASLETVVSPASSIIPERIIHTNILRGKLEVQNPCVFQQDAVVDRIVNKEVDDRQVKTTDNDILSGDTSESIPSKNSYESISELKYSDDFTSSCYSEDFCAPKDTIRCLQSHASSAGAERQKHSPCTSTSKSSEAILSLRKSSSEKSSVLSPPFSAGSPVLSRKISHISKTLDESLEEMSGISASDRSSHWREEKVDQTNRHNSKVVKRGQDVSIKTGTGCKSVERSQSPQTSQVSSYLPSNLSELELKVLDSSPSDHSEGDDNIGSLNISKQCKHICELVINKLPGYTV
jgi:hypothetical protein